MRKLMILFILICIGLFNAYSANLNKADMLLNLDLKMDAKREYIDVIFSNNSESDKAKAYYQLGNIAFSEMNISGALDSWNSLVKKYPLSKEAGLVKNKIDDLRKVVNESLDKEIDNAVAKSYLKNADFWSAGKDNKFIIDSSWITVTEAAVKWYDKTIAEFPDTSAAELAYVGKLRTLIGWKENTRYGEAYGVQSNFDYYMPIVLDTFASFEKSFPKSSMLQGFRYQIAQSYWKHKDWSNTRSWLNKIIEIDGADDSFYKQLAELRLKKVEY